MIQNNQFWFQMPTYWKKKEEEQYQSKIPTASPAVSPVSKQPVATNQATTEPLRKPMMTYDIQGTILPWVSDETAVNLQNYAKANAKNPEEEKLLLQDLHQSAVKWSQVKRYVEDRQKNKAEMVKMSMWAKDPEEKKQIDLSLKLSNISDIIREWAVKEWFTDVWDLDDKDVLSKFVSNNPWQETIISDYLNGKLSNVDVGRQLGLIQEPVVEEKDNWVVADVTAWALASSTWLPRFVANKSAEAIGWAAKQLWADEEKVTNLVNSYKQSISEEQLTKEMWADTESLAFKGTKMAWDIIQVANPAWLWKVGVKAWQIAEKVGKSWKLLSNVAKWATIGAVDTAVFMPVSEQRLATGKEIAVWAAVWWAIPAAVAGVKALRKAPEAVARKLTQTSSAQDKLFKAQNPTLNVLNKNRNFKTVRAESDLANDLVVKAGHKPIDTETRRIAHEATMKSKWAEVESKIADRKTLQVDQRQFAKIIEDTVADAKKSWLVKNTADIKALEAEAKAMRTQRFIDLPSLEKKKQYINWIVNNRWDSAIGDVYKNWMKKVTRAIWEVEDSTLAKIPWEFSALKKEFWVLKSTYEDILKADLKAQKAKWMDVIESYSRIEWISDILWWTLSTFTKGTEWLKDIAKWAWKIFMGKVLKKMKDSDFLIEEWFKDLSSKIK